MKSRVLLLTVLTLLTVQGASVWTQQPAPAPGNPFVAGELLISFEPWVTTGTKAATRGRLGARLKRALRVAVDGQLELATLPRGMSVQAAIAALDGVAGVQHAEPNWVYTHAAVSNDPVFTGGTLWGMLGDLSSPANQYGSQAAEAWAADYIGHSGVYVAVIDEGIDVSHPELAANIWTNPFDPLDGLDNDGNGYVDDVQGWDFAGDNNSVFDGGPGSSVDSHGTHVAGTIGATGGNGVGVVGVNWNVTVIPAKFLGIEGGTTADAVEAINYITDLKTRHGLNIVATNNSWGGGGYSQSLLDAITRAAKADILFIVAAGNANRNNDNIANYPSNYNTTQGTATESPAAYDAVIAVASITNTGSRSSFSNYGRTTVDLGAPGTSIVSTTPNNTYSSYSGTSMATPHVTGAAALYASMQLVAPTAAQIRQAILNSAVATPTNSIATRTVTGGRLNIGHFLGAPPPPEPPAAPDALAASVMSSSRIDVSWADQSSNENGFRIERCQGPSCTNFAQVASVGANVTTYQNTGLVANTTYRYRLVAFNDGGSSGPSNIVDATTPAAPAVPTAPSNLVATGVSSSQINLTWVDQSTDELGFNVERCTGTTCTSFAVIASVGPNIATYQNTTGLVAGTTYRYRVVAFNANGNSTPSNIAAASTSSSGTVPATPTGLVATAGPGPGQITLTWTDNSGNENGFRVFRCGPNTCGSIVQVAETAANVTTFVDAVISGARYSYAVRSFNASGMSAFSNGATTVAP